MSRFACCEGRPTPHRMAPRPGLSANWREAPVTTRKRIRCLAPSTLAALAQGRLPADQMREVQEHLPACSKCLGIVAASIRDRARSTSSAGGSDPVVLERPIRYGSAHLISMVLSFLALGGSIAWWNMGGPVPVEMDNGSGALVVAPVAIPAAATAPVGLPPSDDCQAICERPAPNSQLPEHAACDCDARKPSNATAPPPPPHTAMTQVASPRP
jgi:hypothetical protein